MVFNATSMVSRKEFGMTWNKSLDKGGLMIGNEVKITVNAEALLSQKKS